MCSVYGGRGECSIPERSSATIESSLPDCVREDCHVVCIASSTSGGSLGWQSRVAVSGGSLGWQSRVNRASA